LNQSLENAIAARANLFDAKHQTGLRLFNGFSEGDPNLVIDLYARTALIHNYAEPPDRGAQAVQAAQEALRAHLPWLSCIIVKTRNGRTAQEKNGVIVHGTAADRRLLEHGAWYALELTLNRDASFYLDTRNLRRWAIENLRGKSVLNTFAYTGSLGVAAQAAGAERVVQLDRNKAFLNIAKASYTLNGFPIDKKNFLVADFWSEISHLKRARTGFDCIFLDPPFFAATAKGTVDLQKDAARLINKVRPLANDGGVIVAINNALFESGKQYMQTLQALCADGYLEIEQLIPVPQDFIGYGHAEAKGLPADPAPFNHPTKIAMLRVKRKITPPLIP
jgi:23S rRNA (cytosine1962-C5)-methyltransferase